MKINEPVEEIEKLRVLTPRPDARVPYSFLDDNAVDYSPKVDASNFTFTVKYDIHASDIEDIDIETHPQINFWIGFLWSAEKIKTCVCSGRDRRKTPKDLEHNSSKEFYRFYMLFTMNRVESLVVKVNTVKHSRTYIQVVNNTANKAKLGCSIMTELVIEQREDGITEAGDKTIVSLTVEEEIPESEEDGEVAEGRDVGKSHDPSKAPIEDTSNGGEHAGALQQVKTRSHTVTHVVSSVQRASLPGQPRV